MEFFFDKWEQANEEGKEIITMGDLNLNYLRWDVQPKSMNSYDRLKKPMIDLMKEKILLKGHVILSDIPTKTSNNPDTPNSCLDLMLTNRTEKIASYQAGLPCFSDHLMQIIIRNCKPIQSSKKFIRTSSFKIFNYQQYKINIKNHPHYVEVIYETDPEIITKKIQQIIQDSLQEMSPVVTVQTANKNRTKLSEKVRYMMVARDQAYRKYSQSRNIEDLRELTNLRGLVNKEISREKYVNTTARFHNDGSSMTEKWKLVKTETGQTSNSSPQLIIKNGKLNRQYLQKIRKILFEMEASEIDPLIHYKKVIG